MAAQSMVLFVVVTPRAGVLAAAVLHVKDFDGKLIQDAPRLWLPRWWHFDTQKGWENNWASGQAGGLDEQPGAHASS